MPIEDLKKGTLVIKFLFSCFVLFWAYCVKTEWISRHSGKLLGADVVAGRHY